MTGELTKTERAAVEIIDRQQRDIDDLVKALADLTATCAFVHASYRDGSLGNAIDKLVARADAATLVALRVTTKE